MNPVPQVRQSKTKGGQHGSESSQKEDDPQSKQSKPDHSAAFLRAARSGNYEKVVDFLKENRADIEASNVNGLNALHLSSKDGHVNIVLELLNHGAKIDMPTKKGNTALHIASLAGQLEVVKLLVQHGARINVQSQAGFTPLYMAAQENHADVVKYLLDKGANPNLATEEGFTPMAVALQQDHQQVVNILMEANQKGKVKLSALHVAAKKDDVRAAIMLLENEQNLGERAKGGGIVNEPTKSGFTPLHIAAHYGNQNVANVLIDNQADVNFRARNSITPLHVASKWGRKNIVALLLDRFASVDSKTRDGLTPLHCAARSGHDLVVGLLLDKGAPVAAKTRNGLTALHMAAQGDHVDSARMLISHNAHVDDVTVDYLTPLHVAAHCGNVATAKLLLDRNCEVNARALNGFTPLHIACKKNRIKVIELLLQYGANIGSTTESGLTPLHVASFMGYIDIMVLLLQRKCDPNAPTVRGETSLHLATRGNQVDAMKLLLKNGAEVDAKAKEDQTALHTAARTGSVEAVLLLLQNKASPNAATKELYTPLHIAAKEGHDEVIQVLLEHNADEKLKTSKGFTPLHIAAKYGNVNAGRVLMKNGADPNEVGKNGLTPLHVATHYNHVDMVRLLLEKGSSPHATAKNGYTPLHIAAKKNEIDVATALLEYGAKPNSESRNGFMPLHLAAQEGHTDMVSLLLQNGAQANCRAKNGLTPMHLAAQEDHVPVAEALVKYGGEIDPQTKSGYTPLHTACHFGQLNMIRFLLEHGASVYMTTKAGHTPLHQAAQQGHVLVINMLLRCKADPNAMTSNGQTPLSIAECLGYISVVEILKEITDETTTSTTIENKYKIMSPEMMQEAAMSDEDEDDDADEKHLADQSYQYLTTGDDIGGLHDDSVGDVSGQTREQDPFSTDRTGVEIRSINSSSGVGPTQEDMRYTTDELGRHSGGYLSQHSGDGSQLPAGEVREWREKVPVAGAAQEDQVFYAENGGKNDRVSFDEDGKPIKKRRGFKTKVIKNIEETVITKRLFHDEQEAVTETHFDDDADVSPDVIADTGFNDDVGPYAVEVPSKDQYDFRDITAPDRSSTDEALWNSDRTSKIGPGKDVMGRRTGDEGGTPGKIPRDQFDVRDVTKLENSGADEGQWNSVGTGKEQDEKGRSRMYTPPRDQYDIRDVTRLENSITDEEAQWNGSGTAKVRPGPGRDVIIREDLVSDEDEGQDYRQTDAHSDDLRQEEVAKEVLENRYDLLSAPPDLIKGHGIPFSKSNMSETDSRMFGSTYSGMSFASSFDPDNVALNRQPIYSGFLVSFLVDARGGAMRGCRHSGIRIIIPPGRASGPTRVTCKLVKKEKLPQPPPLLEGEALASRVLVMGPSGAKFLGPVVLEVPHFASLRGTEREITVLRSDNGQTWREHTDLATLESIHNTLCGSFEGEDLESAEELYHKRITRIITSDFPKYFAIVTRIRQETSVLGPKGGIISSTVVPQVQTVFPPGALTKSIKLGLQAHPVSQDVILKSVGGGQVTVSPIVTIEPRRRKFHQPITVTIPLPQELKGTQNLDKVPTLRLLCSMNAGMDPTEWDDITGSTPLTLYNNCISFTTTVSARFWLVNTPSYKEAVKLGSRIYSEALVVPFMANFVIFAKRHDPLDAQLRVFCMTDDKMDKTLESQEKYNEIARSRDVEVLDGKPQWLECSGNLLPVIKSDKSDKQPKINFRAFKENRQYLNVRVRDVDQEPTGVLYFMQEQRTMKDQTPICNLSVVLPPLGGADRTGSNVDTAELQEKLRALKQIEFPEEDLISKAELRLTDIAECLEDDWIPLAKQLKMTEDDIVKVEKEYSYVTEQALVMLHLWIEKNKDGATGNALERALKAIGREDIIRKCIYSVEEVTDVKEKQVAKNYLEKDDEDDDRDEGPFDGHHENGRIEYPGQAIDGVCKDYLLLSAETKTPPSTPADLENMLVSPAVTEDEIVASFAKRDKRSLQDDNDDDPNQLNHNEVKVQPTTDAYDEDDYYRFEPETATLKVYTDMEEGVPEVETDIQETEETLDDGTVIKRRVIKTKQKQTITKRVVMEGPEDELPVNEEEAQEMLRRVEDVDPNPMMRIENRKRVDDAEGGGGPTSSVQDFEETLPDGTIVKRRIVTTTEQQMTTERVVLEGDLPLDDDDYASDEEMYEGQPPAEEEDHIPSSDINNQVAERVEADSGEEEEEETATVMMKREIRKKKILRDGKEETIITEDIHMIQNEEEPQELHDSVQTIIDNFMEGTSFDVDDHAAATPSSSSSSSGNQRKK